MYFCGNCTYIPVELIKRSNKEYYCPCCHTSFDEKLVKTAQFGGQPGGLPSQYNAVPWSTNQTRQVPYGNPSESELGLDTYMGRTRKQVESDDSDRSIEKKLETFHVGLEDDLKPYDLTSRQRQVQTQKDAIRRRNMQQKQFAKSVDENSVAYIKEHFQTPGKYLRTMETQLDTVRKNVTPPRASLPTFTKHDEELLPLPLKRTSQVKMQPGIAKVQHGRNTPFDSEEDPQNPSTIWSARQKTYPEEAGFRDHTSWVENQFDFDQGAFGNEEFSFLVAPEDTTAFPRHEPRPYESYIPTGTPPQPEKQQTAPLGDIEGMNNPYLPLQEKMNRIQNQRNPQQQTRLPNDPFPGEDASQILMRPSKPTKPYSAYQDKYYYQSTADGTPLGG